ncbi:MAG: hypothetical protein RBT20_04115 [Syntrophales bacterium]|nr:hypothetical protein [Syntrophales bacterium]
MKNGWTKRIEELEESRNNWKREWSLLNAALNMAEDRIKELEAERDADRKREYGYSQQTVDALTAERDKLTARVKELEESRDSWKREWRLSNAGLDMAEKRIAELEAENMRLQLMNPCKHTGFEAAPCDVCGYPDPRKLIAKLKAENKRLRELVDGATEVVEISNFTFPAQREWKAAWLKKAAKAMKEASHD